jgi:hypothetical protein
MQILADMLAPGPLPEVATPPDQPCASDAQQQAPAFAVGEAAARQYHEPAAAEAALLSPTLSPPTEPTSTTGTVLDTVQDGCSSDSDATEGYDSDATESEDEAQAQADAQAGVIAMAMESEPETNHSEESAATDEQGDENSRVKKKPAPAGGTSGCEHANLGGVAAAPPPSKKRPRGRAPKGRQWDATAGEWAPTSVLAACPSSALVEILPPPLPPPSTAGLVDAAGPAAAAAVTAAPLPIGDIEDLGEDTTMAHTFSIEILSLTQDTIFRASTGN